MEFEETLSQLVTFTDRGFIIFLLAFFTPAVVAENITRTEHNLHRKLFQSYKPDVMPIKSKSETIEISVDIFIMNIDNTDEKRKTFIIRRFLKVKWINQFLREVRGTIEM